MLSHWKIIVLLILVIGIAITLVTFGIYNTQPKQEVAVNEGIILGFSQIGAESAWRKCNTQSIKEAASNAGVQLLFENAEQKQENQIKAIRSFIAYQVDVIAFVPIVTDGWDNILKEAKIAGIPVLVTDRKITTTDPDLYAGFIGTDSEQEGREAGNFLLKKFKNRSADDPVRIIEISGTEGSSVAVGRADGIREIIGDNPRFKIIHSISGDFLRSKGYEIMRNILKEFSDIDALYSHNDGMTLGAIDAMKEVGIRPGEDIVIITIDARQDAIDALRAGEVNCVIECNPKTGPAILTLSHQLARGETIPKLQHVEEEVFTEYDDLSAIGPRGY
jgi:galactofuranose transport system substrate-binding protein